MCRLAHACSIEPNRPARRYNYLLLDPQDEAYAVCRFYCRKTNFLNQLQIIYDERSVSPNSVATSISNYFDTETSPQANDIVTDDKSIVTESAQKHSLVHDKESLSLLSLEGRLYDKSNTQELNINKSKVKAPICVSRSQSSLSIKDSIEDLTSRLRCSSTTHTSCKSQHVLRANRPSLQKEGQLSDVESVGQLSPSQKSSSVLPVSPELGSMSQRQLPTKTTLRDWTSHGSHASSPQYCIQRPDPSDLLPCGSRHKSRPDLRSSLQQRGSRISNYNLDAVASKCNRKASTSSIVSISSLRPLSPFTNGGFLRRLKSGIDIKRNPSFSSEDESLSAPPVETNHVPIVQHELNQAMEELILKSCQATQNLRGERVKQEKSERTARKQRGGLSLISTLDKRINKHASS